MRKVIIITLITILIMSLAALVYYLVVYNKEDSGRGLIMEIPEWNYRLEDTATSLMIEEFTRLKEILTADEIDNTAYAETVARLFVADLYTLSNKQNKYDITSSQFMLPSFEDNFRLNVQNTIYRFLEDNTAGNRTQRLPEVNSVRTVSQEAIQFEIDDEEFEAYQIVLTWTFTEDMGYDDNAVIILIRDGKFFHIVEKNRSS